MSVNLPALMAEDALAAGAGRTPKSVYDLHYARTGDREIAEEKRAEFINRLLRMDQPIPMDDESEDPIGGE